MLSKAEDDPCGAGARDKLETVTISHDTETEAGEKPERLGAARVRSSVHLDTLVPKEGMGFRPLLVGGVCVDDKGTAENFCERSEQTQNF